MRASLDSLRNQHRVVLGVMLAVCLPFGLELAASVALGGVMQSINLQWLERTVRGWATQVQAAADSAADSATDSAEAIAQGGGLSQAAGVRLICMLGAVGAVFLLVPIHPIGLTVGLSTAVPAVLWHGLTTVPNEA